MEGQGMSEKTVHELKCWPESFSAVVTGRKKHELRRCDDRRFAAGDSLRLREYDPTSGTYSGNEAIVDVTYVTLPWHISSFSPEALAENFCIMSIELKEWSTV